MGGTRLTPRPSTSSRPLRVRTCSRPTSRSRARSLRHRKGGHPRTRSELGLSEPSPSSIKAARCHESQLAAWLFGCCPTAALRFFLLQRGWREVILGSEHGGRGLSHARPGVHCTSTLGCTV